MTNITIFIRARPILIDLPPLQIKLSRPNAAHPSRWKTEELTRIHLLQVMNGPPAPPAARYPSAGESSVGATVVPMVVKTEQQLEPLSGALLIPPLGTIKFYL